MRSLTLWLAVLAGCGGLVPDGPAPDPDGGPGPGPEVTTPTSFTLTSTESGALPFTIGLGFGAGDVPSTFALELPTAQVDIKRRWNDGSVKHAVVSGIVELTAGQPRVVQIVSGSHSGGTALTCGDIATKAPQVTASFGTLGTVSLSSLLASPLRTWLTGTEAVECHYAAPVGSDRTLRASFHVRLYRDGRLLVRAIAENGYLDRAAADKSYVPRVTIGGTVAFDNGGRALNHRAHTRWLAEGWIGGAPGVLGVQDPEYLLTTRLVPNYWMAKRAAPAALDRLFQRYAPCLEPSDPGAPMTCGDWTPQMGDTGFQPMIGLLPSWEAMVFTSNGDLRAVRATIANAYALGSFPIVWRDPVDDLPVRPDGRPTWTVGGDGAGGENGVGAGRLFWEVAHHPSGGYTAYLLTGDYVHLETLQHQASTVFLVSTSSNGRGTSRILRGQVRGSAWSQRTVGQLAAIGPDDAVTRSYRELLASNAAHHARVATMLGADRLGVVYGSSLNEYGPGGIAPWQQNFFAQTYGYLSDLEPLADMTALDAVRDYVAKVPVGMLGDGAASYCFTRAGSYTIKVSATEITELAQMVRTWREVDVATHGNQPCGTRLGGDSGGAPRSAATGYWGNLLPAISYAVDHGAPGAEAAWDRLTGAANWSEIDDADWAQAAPWAIVPRRP